MTIRDEALHLNVGWDLIKEIQKRDLLRRYFKPKHMRYIAIDEIAIAKGHRYLTVLMDRGSGAIVFVRDGKEADALNTFWKRLRPSKAKIEAVAMAKSRACWGAVLTHLPKAKIVFDHFHRCAMYRKATDVTLKECLGSVGMGQTVCSDKLQVRAEGHSCPRKNGIASRPQRSWPFYGFISLSASPFRIRVTSTASTSQCSNVGKSSLFENGAAAFESCRRRVGDDKDRRITLLQQKLRRKNKVLSELMEEHINLKKELWEF
jgi:Transposase